jgi:N-acetyl-alpha-D-glucosaminyl L-malate synthase BshA
VTTLHGTDIHTIGKKKDFKSVIKFTLENSDGIVAVSKYLANQAKEIEIDSEVKVIPNYIDTELFKPDDSREIKKLRKEFAKEKEKIILHVSNFRKVKRIENIIRSFNLIKRKTKSNLVLVGSGPELKKMKELVERLKLKKKVFFAGKQKKIEKYYAIADLFLLASDKEGFPLSILEAMSSGVPVVSAKSGGVPEMVISGKTGYLVEREDVRGMASRAIKILTSAKLRREMGEAARQEVLSKYTKERIIAQYEDYFMNMTLKKTKV